MKSKDWLFESASQLDAKRIENPACSLNGDCVVLVTFVSRDLRLMNPKPLSELSLCEPKCNAQRHQ